MWQDKDIPQILLRLKQSGQMLFAIVEDNNLISNIFFEEENLGRISSGIVSHRVHPVNELQQHPYGKDHALIRLAHGVHPQIVPAGDFVEHDLVLERTNNLFCRLRRFVLQHSDNLRFRQRPYSVSQWMIYCSSCNSIVLFPSFLYVYNGMKYVFCRLYVYCPDIGPIPVEDCPAAV